MHIIRQSAYRQMPWKNGGGVTTEIAVSPPGAAVDEFDWRISMARIATDGPFSSFPRIDRNLCILEGQGIHLSVSGRAEVRLARETAPYSFPADAPTSARLTGGPIVDLNVMTRRGRYTHRVTRLTETTPVEWNCTGGTTVILAYSTALLIRNGENSTSLAQGDSAILHGAGKLTLSPDGPGKAYIIEFSEA